LRFKDVKVPRENIIWGEGKGLKLALMTLNTGRLTMPASVTGASKWCLKAVRQWALEREQWGAAIGKHEAIAAKIASMSATLFAMDAVSWLTSHMADNKKKDIRLEAAMAKLCCTEASWRIVDGAIQIRGGRGYETADSLRARGEKALPFERIMRDMRINTIIEGTSQIMRLFIAREAMDIHFSNLMPIMSPKTNLLQKLGAAVKAFGFYALWYPRQFIHGAGLPSGVMIPGRVKKHMVYASKTAHRLARELFHAMMIYQQKLERRQLILARLVNIGTDLFAISASCSLALSRCQSNPEDNSSELADLFCRQARGRIEKQFRGLYSNNDQFAYKIARDTLDGKHSWLETGIIDPE